MLWSQPRVRMPTMRIRVTFLSSMCRPRSIFARWRLRIILLVTLRIAAVKAVSHTRQCRRTTLVTRLHNIYFRHTVAPGQKYRLLGVCTAAQLTPPGHFIVKMPQRASASASFLLSIYIFFWGGFDYYLQRFWYIISPRKMPLLWAGLEDFAGAVRLPHEILWVDSALIGKAWYKLYRWRKHQLTL